MKFHKIGNEVLISLIVSFLTQHFQIQTLEEALFIYDSIKLKLIV